MTIILSKYSFFTIMKFDLDMLDRFYIRTVIYKLKHRDLNETSAYRVIVCIRKKEVKYR